MLKRPFLVFDDGKGDKMNNDHRSTKIFMGWLHENSEAFQTLEFVDKDYTFKFRNTFPGLSFYVGLNDITAWFDYQGDGWDGILVADLPEIEKENDSFFCKECFEYTGKKKTYDSIESLFEDHTIRHFRNWLRQNLYAGKEVLLFKASGSTWVKLCHQGEVEEIINDMTFKKYGVAVEPL